MATDVRHAPHLWSSADLRFEPGPGWIGQGESLQPWTVTIRELTIELRPTSSGGLGLYPEHANSIEWLTSRIRQPGGGGRSPTVLNLFAHTGLLTLAAARAGASVVHVDGSKTVVAWARRNAELSGLSDRPIRWLVDDALGFVQREARRGRRYDGLILDPPSYGHAKGRRWRLADGLLRLSAACAGIAAEGAFVLLTAHTTGVDDAALASIMLDTFGPMEPTRLSLRAESGAVLDLGWSIQHNG